MSQPADNAADGTESCPRTKRIAVLCPGPSLPTFGDHAAYDLRIGVNRAAGAFLCDYWVALDVHTAGLTRPIGQPMIVNKPNIYRAMCREFSYVRGLRHIPHTRLTVKGLRRSKVCWPRFGATVALILAGHLGAEHVDCFGVDWDGEEDFDGFTFHRNRRNENRWKREKEVWSRVCEVLLANGVTVSREGPPPRS